jgi:hypothetical protein
MGADAGDRALAKGRPGRAIALRRKALMRSADPKRAQTELHARCVGGLAGGAL